MAVVEDKVASPGPDDPGVGPNEEHPIGYGRLKRKEDVRFIRGKGNYVDDVQLPGMLYGSIVRSPYAHARILSIDTSAAEAHPKVKAVITGATLEALGLAWMPTLSNDTQSVLATDKVRFQGQEVAFVVAEDHYAARDAIELIGVEYEPLPPVIDARHALDADAPVIRTDKEGQTDNFIFDWESGDKDATAAVFDRADVVVKQYMLYPRVHPAPLETCGCVADMDPVSGKLTMTLTTQAPHAHRTLYALVAGIPEHKIRVIAPDIGGGFGNKVGIYPGYVCAIVGSILTRRPVKWVEDRSENLMSTSFARDYHMHGEIAATREGKILAVRVDVLADHGAFNGTAQPSKFPAGFFHIFTGSYDLEAAYCAVRGVYTNKAPGGVAYACSFRVTEAVYLVERLVDCLADELGLDPAQLRLDNLLRPDQFPYECPTGWIYDSGDYATALRKAMDLAGYQELRQEQARRRARRDPVLMGIGISFFTESVGAGPREQMDILGLGMADGCELRVHPTGSAVVRISVETQGQGHETTFAQIVAEELGIPPEDIEVVHGDTDQTPFGLGTYGSRSTPVSGAACAMVARKVRDKARLIAGAMLEVAPEDLEWEKGRWFVKGDPTQGKTIREIAFASFGALHLPEGVEGHLDAEVVYNPPNLTFPFGAYICVVDVDQGTGQVKVRRFIAVDDCGTRINPMIVEGQIHGGLADGVGMALMEIISFDEDGNCLGGSFMDYLIPTAKETPSWELGSTVTPSPHHPIGAKGIGESRDRRVPARDRQRGPRRHRCPSRRHALDPESGLACHERRGGGTAMTAPGIGALNERMAQLLARRVPFVRATVVRARRPTSANPGDTALILEDGEIEGFVGGACAEATVRRFALDVLHSGEPVLLRISPDQVGDGDLIEGAIVVGNPCLSGGELEVFLEPRRPAPRVVVLGETPIGRSLVVLGQDLGYDIQPVDDVVSGVEAMRGAAAVVVASHGRDEEAVLTAALAWGVPYVALVASRKRATAVLDSLDVTPEQRASVRAPAGLDIGAHSAGEVALSILAEVVASVRAQPSTPHSEEPPPTALEGVTRTVSNDRFHAAFAIDPTCGMSVAAVDSTLHSDVTGERQWFCCAGCKSAFEAEASASTW